MFRPDDLLMTGRAACFGGALLLLGACASGPVESPSRSSSPIALTLRPTTAPSGAVAPTSSAPVTEAVACRRSLCLTGAGDHRFFESFCDSELVGRIDDCRTTPCRNTFSTFPMPDAASVWNAVFETLDRTRDGLLDAADGTCQLDVIGYSWGGVNAVNLAARMSNDSRVKPPWRVTRLILLDSFQPGAMLEIPLNVDKTFSFRHSMAPANECSKDALLGPYLGIAPTCTAAQACRDFDFSRDPEQSFGGQRGDKVDHCGVPRAALAAMKQILRDEKPTSAPRDE